MKKKNLMRRLSLLLTAAALPLIGIAQRVSLPYGYAARGGMSYCPNTYLPGWMAVDPNQPVQDATFLIGNPSFESGDAEPWSGNPDINGEEGHKYALMSGVFDVFQVLEGIPNGVYELSVNGFYEGDKSPRCAWLYAGNNTMALKTVDEGNPDLWNSANVRTVRTIVINHSLRVGVKGIYESCGETSFDDFQLRYVGKYVVGFAATIAENYTGVGTDDVPVGSWKAGQQVAVHASNAAYQYEALSDGASTKLVAGDNDNHFPKLGLSYTAARPYDNAALAETETETTLTLPQTQTYVAGGIDTLANPMAAFSDNTTLAFKNVCGLLKLNLTGDGDNVSVRTVSVKAKGENVMLWGTGAIGQDDLGNPTWTYNENGGDSVALVVPDGEENVSLGATAVPFYIALPPAYYESPLKESSGGLTVTVTDGTGNEFTTDINVEILRSKVTEADTTVVYKSLKIEAEYVGLTVGQDSTLSYTKKPEVANLTWTSSDETVATIVQTTDGTFTIHAVDGGLGQAVVKAVMNNSPEICDSCIVNVGPVGGAYGLFTVGTTADGPVKTFFSKGNLQFHTTDKTWRFAEHQYDMCDENTGTQPTEDYNENSDKWIGLFGWGTSGHNHGAICYQPWSTETDNSKYYAYGDVNNGLYSNDGSADWGCNVISNGGNAEKQWRTLTGGNNGEWNYLLTQRATTYGAGTTTENRRYAEVKVNDVPGVLLFPDVFSWPLSVDIEPTTFNINNSNWNNVNYDAAEFSVLESAGCVFLPCAGYRYGTKILNVGTNGYYWSSSPNGFNYACGLYFSPDDVNPASNFVNRCTGYSVRLTTLLPVPAASLSIAPVVVGMEIGSDTTLVATVAPLNTTDVVTWSSSDETVASVDNTGKVTAVSVGTATITATAGEKTATCKVTVAPVGAIHGLFTIGMAGSNPIKVCFSKGNLQFHTTDKTWRFAENQYDLVDSNTEEHTTDDYADNSGKWIDLFCWGTSGHDHGANCYQPWSTSGEPSDYYAYGDENKGLYSEDGSADWGCNAISNGGDAANYWRTLTGGDSGEWKYLLNDRQTTYGTGTMSADNRRYAEVKVDGVCGLLVFPDEFSWPLAADMEPTTFNTYSSNWNNVNYNADKFSVLEQNGCVFLPCAGNRDYTTVSYVGMMGCYCSSSPNGADYVYFLGFYSDGVNPVSHNFRGYGWSVRLAHVPAASLNVVPNSVILGKGESTSLTAVVMPANSTATVVWKSDDERVAIVGQDGKVETVGFGTAHITASADGKTATCTVTVAPRGGLLGEFTVGMDEGTPIKVNFSKGNLQFHTSSKTWRFAENQYDLIDGNPLTHSTEDYAENSGEWIDLFGWGTSGHDHGATCYQPWSTDETNSNYYAYGDQNKGLYDGDGSADWGCNAISNGGNAEKQWRTLTGGDDGEWKYLLDSRTTSYGSGTETENRRYAEVKVNGVYGLLVFPDEFSWPEGAGTEPTTFNTYSSNWNNVNYDAVKFSVLEQNGCVFLPCAGYRNGTSVINVGSYGHYWSSTVGSASSAYRLYFYSGNVTPAYSSNRYFGFSVRLVTSPVEATSLALEEDALMIKEGSDPVSLHADVYPTNSTDVISWSSSNEDVATVDNDGKVTAVGPGTTSVIARISAVMADTCLVTVFPEKVQLWDGGPYFATCNVGAVSPCDFGDYYAWASTDSIYESIDPTTGTITFKEGYEDGFVIANAPYYNGSSYTKYNAAGATLEAEDDVATKRLGGGWHTPDKADLANLRGKCYWEWTDNYSGTEVNGYVVYKRKAGDTSTTYNVATGATYSAGTDTHIFLPAAGYCDGVSYKPYNDDDNNSKTYYWSRSCSASSPFTNAYIVTFRRDNVSMDGATHGRHYGVPVRPVKAAVPEGAINGKFSVSADKQVYFSKGNLQFHTGSKTWRFAENQYDLLDSNTEDHQTSVYGENTNNWIDLFGWGTSGHDHGATCYQPWSTDETNSNYYAYNDQNKGLYDSDGSADWGCNAISNGGDAGNQWRTLTGGSNGEWVWLLGPNSDANPGTNCRTTSYGSGTGTPNRRYAEVKVNEVCGLLVFPDEFSWPLSADMEPTTFNDYSSDWNDVDYNAAQFSVLEQNGCVFLPCAGYRRGTAVKNVGTNGHYWSSTAISSSNAYLLYFYSGRVSPADSNYRYVGFSVRLVCPRR